MNIPQLRFPNFEGKWKLKTFGSVTTRVSDPVAVADDSLYQQIGIRSHGKGIFHKEFVDGRSLGNKRIFWVKANALVVNIVFAWEQAIAKTTDKEKGMVASHRFPMYMPNEGQSNLDYLLYFFLTKKGKALLELASPGGAGRNKTLGQKEFEKLAFAIPEVQEQQKIAAFLTAVDERLQALKKKKTLLEQYKKGIMQQIFSQQLRFKDDDGGEFPDWEEKTLGEVAEINMGQSPDSKTYNTAGLGLPLIQGNADIENRKSRPRNFTESPTKICDAGDIILTVRAPVGATARSLHRACIGRGVCSIRCSAVCVTDYIYQYLLQYEPKWARLEQGSTFTAINGSDVKSVTVLLPSLNEQTKIANFLSALDEKIRQTELQIEKTDQYKKGLLQQMFC